MASSTTRAALSPGGLRSSDGTPTHRAKYHHTVEPLGVTKRDGAIVVIGRVSGQFPGSPVELQHVFSLNGQEITSLEIG